MEVGIHTLDNAHIFLGIPSDSDQGSGKESAYNEGD